MSATAGAALAVLVGAMTTAQADPRASLPLARVTALTIASDRCYPDWSDAAPIVRRQALVAVKDVLALARQRQIGDLVKVTLCEEAERFVYRLVVREASGRIVAMTIDAKTPFAP